MITASHLPYNRNGFKFFTKEGGYEKKDISELLTLAAEEHAAENAPNTAADARYRDEAFVLSSALHSEPGLIEQVGSMRPLWPHDALLLGGLNCNLPGLEMGSTGCSGLRFNQRETPQSLPCDKGNNCMSRSVSQTLY